MKLSCIETSEIVGNDVYASSFLTIFRFGVERSGTENKSRATAFWNLLRMCATVCHGTYMAEGSELLATPQASFYYRKALIDGTDLLPLLYCSILFSKCQLFGHFLREK
jgi:hypothetical protein